MRIIHFIVLVLGLMLVSYAPFEIHRIRHYWSVVKDVQKETEQRFEAYRDNLRQLGMIVDPMVRIRGDLWELDAAARLERGWWVVFGIGIAVSLVGLSGLVCTRASCDANNPLHATAAPPGS